jgi:hypothetical protein
MNEIEIVGTFSGLIINRNKREGLCKTNRKADKGQH